MATADYFERYMAGLVCVECTEPVVKGVACTNCAAEQAAREARAALAQAEIEHVTDPPPMPSLYPASASGEYLASRSRNTEIPMAPPYLMCQLPDSLVQSESPDDDVMARPSHIGELLRKRNT